MKRLLAPLLAAFAAAVAPAAPLTLVKSSSVVADSVSTANPKALPGATVDYALMVTNPVANGIAPVGSIAITETIPATVKLRIADYGASGSGPVEFGDGSLLGTGLLATGLAYRFTSLASASDGLEFSDGSSWAYVPVADAAGCDAHVRAIRVTMTGTHAAGTSFRLRYRVQVN
ncbi:MULTISPECIES: hypothetical protein [unclassified Sphingomonas]|uniref:hypothetical protein n=1 Tax=unclassified Sphingomonas TaxID=196159 RepID=UPI001F5693AB|nr:MULTISPECIES: hypothetical protein [unclassified Sphingomonas]